MIKIFRTIDRNVHQISEAQEGSWISLINPTATELVEIAETYGIDVDHLRAPLDEEEQDMARRQLLVKRMGLRNG